MKLAPFQLSESYLEDGLRGRNVAVVNNHGERFRPQDLGLWDPFQNGRTPWLINGADPNYLLNEMILQVVPSSNFTAVPFLKDVFSRHFFKGELPNVNCADFLQMDGVKTPTRRPLQTWIFVLCRVIVELLILFSTMR